MFDRIVKSESFENDRLIKISEDSITLASQVAVVIKIIIVMNSVCEDDIIYIEPIRIILIDNISKFNRIIRRL